MKKSLLKIAALGGLLTPFFALGQQASQGQTVEGLISRAYGVVRSIIPLLVLAAVAVFIWGIIKFMSSTGDEQKRKSAIQIITYGIIGMFVMVAIWGIVAILAQFFGVTLGGPAPTLTVPPINSSGAGTPSSGSAPFVNPIY